MGFNHSWIAVKGLSREAALAELGMEPARVLSEDEFPDRLAVADLPNGWLLIMFGDYDTAFEPRFVGLSRHGPVVACALEEHVMVSEARGYADGAETWRVSHDSDHGTYHLAVSGDPPPAFEEIRRALTSQQDAEGGEKAGVDFIFDAPADLASALCGFKLGEGDFPEFTELRRIGEPEAEAPPAARPSLFQRLFGRR